LDVEMAASKLAGKKRQQAAALQSQQASMVLSLRCRSGQALASAEADQPGALVILIELA
jgi:hypothetical protein